MLRIDGISAARTGIQANLEQFNVSADNVVTSALTSPVPAPGALAPLPTLATSNGQPTPDVAGEIVNMMVAQNGVAANVVVVQRAVDTYRDLLAMTNRDRDRLASSPPVSAA